MNVPHTSTGRTPAEVIFKRLPHTHLSMIVPDMTERLKNQLQTKEELKQPRSFAEDDMVFIRDHRPTSIHKWIEGRVSSKTGALSYIVDLEGTNARHMWTTYCQGHRLPNYQAIPLKVLHSLGLLR